MTGWLKSGRDSETGAIVAAFLAIAAILAFEIAAIIQLGNVDPGAYRSLSSFWDQIIQRR